MADVARLPNRGLKFPQIADKMQKHNWKRPMSEIAHLAATIFKRAGKAKRFIVAIAGPPGAGKSTLSASLHGLLPEGASEVVPMDGFHYDDIVLNLRGLRPRKGAPETFDFAGFEALLKRIRSGEPDIALSLIHI